MLGSGFNYVNANTIDTKEKSIETSGKGPLTCAGKKATAC